MKVNSKIYRGIEYVQLNELPQEQKEKLLQELHDDFLIKILIDDTVIRNCIQYKDYEFWFDNVYKRSSVVTPVKFESVAEAAEMSVAVGKV
jgi:hypothetical protein